MENKDLLRQKCLEGASAARKLGGELDAFRDVLDGVGLQLTKVGPERFKDQIIAVQSFLREQKGAADALYGLASNLELFADRELR